MIKGKNLLSVAHPKLEQSSEIFNRMMSLDVNQSDNLIFITPNFTTDFGSKLIFLSMIFINLIFRRFHKDESQIEIYL